jgi:branched-chain amino acid transport system permease protein
LGLGLGLSFLTLIGLPSQDSEQLAALALPIYLLIGFGLCWYWSKTSESLGKVLARSLVVGLAAAIPLLLLLAQVNRWQAEGVRSTVYFNTMTTYPMQILSGVPERELFANPAPNPITGEYDSSLRTDPMRLYLNQEAYSLVSVGGLHLGGFYGLALLLILACGLGGVAHWAARSVDWGAVLRFSQSPQYQQITHWLWLSAPLIFFSLFWLTVAHNGGSLQVINLKEVFGLTNDSLIDAQSMQLGLVFLMILTSVLGLRRAEDTPFPWPTPARMAVLVGLVVAMTAFALLRIQQDGVVFILPSFDLFGLSGADYSRAGAVVFGLALGYFAFRQSQDPRQFQMAYIIILGLGLLMMAPLYMDQYQSFVTGRVVLAIMFGMGLNIVIGYAGLLDLGYVAFYAIGAYAFAFLALENDQSKITAPHLNALGWAIAAAFVFSPWVIFAFATWQSRQALILSKPANPYLKTMAKVWEQQPPLLISLGLIALAVAIGLGGRLILSEFFAVSAFSSFLVTIVVAMIAAAFTGIALGVPILRLRGDYLAIVTLGFGEIISLGLKNLGDLTGAAQGANGVPGPVPAGTPIPSQYLATLYLSIFATALLIFFSWRLRHSRLGRAWVAMSSDEDIAQAMGINLVNVKLLAFSIGASFAGLSGMLFASWQRNIFPENFTLTVSINVLSLVIIGGMGSIPGVVIGALVLIGLPELLRPIQEYRIMTFGLLLVLTMVALPRGLLPTPPPRLEEEARRLAEEEDKRS